MGGDAGFPQLVDEGQKLGFKIMPMYGMNSANKKLPMWPKIADAITQKIDGDVYNLNWVDWNNDRHQDGWLGYMNLGVDSWRKHLEGRIAEMIEKYGVDAYFLDIAGGHVNSTNGDMHEGTRRLVLDLRAKYPKVACIGEMPYDALHAFIPMYHAGGGPRWQQVQPVLSAPEQPGAGSREQRRARVRLRAVQHGDVVAVAQRDSDVAGGRRHVREASRRDGRDHPEGEGEGRHLI